MNVTFTAQLFLGFPVDEVVTRKLSTLNPNVLSIYLSEGDQYLKQLSYKGMDYIGKNVPEAADLMELQLLEANIYSLLNKLLFDYPCQKTPLVLFAII